MSYTGNDHDNRLLSPDAAEAELAEIVGFKIDIPTAERRGFPPSKSPKSAQRPSCSYSSYSSGEKWPAISMACSAIGNIWGLKSNKWGLKGNIWGLICSLTGNI